MEISWWLIGLATSAPTTSVEVDRPMLFIISAIRQVRPSIPIQTTNPSNSEGRRHHMARRFRLLLLLLFAVFSFSSARASLGESDANPIRYVTDRESLRSSLLAVIGRSRDSLRFARFALRYSINNASSSFSLSLSF